MPYSLQQLSGLEEIRTLKHRYFRSIDTADMDLLSGLFTEDVAVDYRGGTYRVMLDGRANMIEFLANSFHSGAVAMHHGHMPEITLIGADMAEGIWYLEDGSSDRKGRPRSSDQRIGPIGLRHSRPGRCRRHRTARHTLQHRRRPRFRAARGSHARALDADDQRQSWRNLSHVARGHAAPRPPARMHRQYGVGGGARRHPV